MSWSGAPPPFPVSNFFSSVHIYAPFAPLHHNLRDKLCVEEQKNRNLATNSQTEGLRCQTESCTDQPTVRQPGGQTVGTADRLAVGVSPLMRSDSFHAGSCDSEREDRVRFRLFDVGVVFAFEVTAHFASVCFFKLCCARLPELPGTGAVGPFQ